jgi:hypothetical protein
VSLRSANVRMYCDVRRTNYERLDIVGGLGVKVTPDDSEIPSFKLRLTPRTFLRRFEQTSLVLSLGAASFEIPSGFGNLMVSSSRGGSSTMSSSRALEAFVNKVSL